MQSFEGDVALACTEQMFYRKKRDCVPIQWNGTL